jgi:hypothetical protein
MAAPPFRYVSYDLEFSEKAVRVLWDNRADGPVSAEELATLLGYTGRNNGAFLTRLGNLRLFGLLEGPSSALRVSDLARRILHPEYPEDADAARVEAFENVPLFKAVLDRYNGVPLPGESGMKNVLETTFGVSKEKSAFVLTRLMDSAEQAGLFKLVGNRTKMHRPSAISPRAASSPAPQSVDHVAEPVAAVATAPTSGGRFSKLIEGVLDEFPEDRDGWTEPEMLQALSLLEQALRLYYRFPNGGTREEANR